MSSPHAGATPDWALTSRASGQGQQDRWRINRQNGVVSKAAPGLGSLSGARVRQRRGRRDLGVRPGRQRRRRGCWAALSRGCGRGSVGEAPRHSGCPPLRVPGPGPRWLSTGAQRHRRAGLPAARVHTPRRPRCGLSCLLHWSVDSPGAGAVTPPQLPGAPSVPLWREPEAGGPGAPCPVCHSGLHSPPPAPRSAGWRGPRGGGRAPLSSCGVQLFIVPRLRTWPCVSLGFGSAPVGGGGHVVPASIAQAPPTGRARQGHPAWAWGLTFGSRRGCSHRVLLAAWRSGEMGSMAGPDLGSGLGTPPGLPRCGQAA